MVSGLSDLYNLQDLHFDIPVQMNHKGIVFFLAILPFAETCISTDGKHTRTIEHAPQHVLRNAF